jgi:Domain of unknown function (DUF1905)
VPTFEFSAPLWRWQGDAAWHFVTLPHDAADDIDELSATTRRGFGSVRVEVTVGSTSWRTSVFPDTAAQSYVLPVKRSVRDAEGLAEGELVNVLLRPIDT